MTLTTILGAASNTLIAYESALSTVQQNVSNASVPSYTSLTPNFTSTATGVKVNGIIDARNLYAEHTVWDANSRLGTATTASSNLTIIQSQFDVSGAGGVPGALSKAYSAFSAWGTNPSDSTAQNQVIQAASQVVSAFNSVAASLQSSRLEVDQQIQNTTSSINAIEDRLVDINVQIGQNGGSDPTLQAQLYAQLQQLSQYTTLSVHIESNGTATVLINGQVPLVVGNTANKLTVKNPNATTPVNPAAPADAAIVDSTGQDITAIAGQQGQLAGLLKIRNETIPSLIGNQTQQGSLNKLAQGFADQVNALLESGQPSSSQVALFKHSNDATQITAGTADATAVASTLSVNTAFATSNLVASNGTTGNGIANQLAGLATASNPALGHSFTDYYSTFVASLGTQASAANDAKTNLADQLTQADNLRSNISGVDTNEQAALLQQYQQAFQATSKLFGVVNNLYDTLLAIVPSA